MTAAQLLKHLFMPDWMARRAFPAAALSSIEQAIDASEKAHDGEIRFVVEAGLPLPYLFRENASRQRAEDLFAQLRVWDTERNSGVLVYVQLVSHDIEIVADRGIGARVGQEEWEAICRTMESAYRQGAFLDGSLAALRQVTALLARHFQPPAANPDELSDKPLLL